MRDPEAYDRGFARLSSHTVQALLAAVTRGADVTPGLDGRVERRPKAGGPGRRPEAGGPGQRQVRILDVGCGTGVVTAAALAAGAEVTAVDADAAMLELVARRHPAATVRRATLPVLPFEDACFDAVAGNFVVNHVADVPATLAELRRVLRPGGAVALTWWKSDEMTATNVFAEALAAAGVPYEPPVRPFAAVERPERFAGLMKEAGFTAVDVRTLRWRHRVDVAAWWSGVVEAGGPRFETVARQPPETYARVRACYDRLAAPYADEGFPVCAHLARGLR
ncbi:class I SAM-dependent methyltransferase [Nonomuraea sp. NPDC049684]|uniref:class I SAM-dependent methyltransferase n=1 Tax=Nonomuraea sp. NPDC049684 TaxID=3364356 RepID=UPI0037A68061